MRASVNVSLPEDMWQWVEEQVRSGGYGTVSEFFRELLRQAKKQQTREEIVRKMLAALESGAPVPVTATTGSSFARKPRSVWPEYPGKQSETAG